MVYEMEKFSRLRERKELQRRHGRRRFRLAMALGFKEIGDKKCEIERLLGIEPWIADGVIEIVQILVADSAGAAGAFGSILSRHFQMHAAGIGAFGRMHLEKRPHF